ncbi:MAG: Rho termination factor N-terminal domain-containing protein, partial [Chitinophagaceae bacterium]
MLEELRELNREVLEGKVIAELKEIAKELNISGTTNLKKEALIERILKAITNLPPSSKDKSAAAENINLEIKEKPVTETEEEVGKVPVDDAEPERKFEGDLEVYEEKMKGILDILSEGYGFLRTTGYLQGPNDIYVSQS